MTYNLPESDRIAVHVNPILDNIATMDSTLADAVEVGAVTVIGLMSESLADLRDKSIAEAQEQGLPAEAATRPFEVVTDALFNIAQPRIDALRAAVQTAQGEPEEPSIDDLLEGLFAALIGPEAATAVRAEVEAADEAAAEVEDEGQPEESDEDAAAREVEQFLNDLFNRR
jgi:hypothetical protein